MRSFGAPCRQDCAHERLPCSPACGVSRRSADLFLAAFSRPPGPGGGRFGSTCRSRRLSPCWSISLAGARRRPSRDIRRAYPVAGQLALLGLSALTIAWGGTSATAGRAAFGTALGMALFMLMLYRERLAARSGMPHLLPTGAFDPRTEVGAVTTTMALMGGGTAAYCSCRWSPRARSECRQSPAVTSVA